MMSGARTGDDDGITWMRKANTVFPSVSCAVKDDG